MGSNRKYLFKTVKYFYNYIAKLWQKLLGEFKTIGENAKGGNDRYWHGVRPVREFNLIVNIYRFDASKLEEGDPQVSAVIYVKITNLGLTL